MERVRLCKAGVGGYSKVFHIVDTDLVLKLVTIHKHDYHQLLREGLVLGSGIGIALRCLTVNEDLRFSGFVMPRASATVYTTAKIMYSKLDIMLANSIVLTWCEQLAYQLRGLHEAGVVHLDIKPQNCLVDQDGDAVLADFGLCARAHLEQGLTGAFVHDSRVCTIWYRPPEAFKDPQEVSTATDVWSLGATVLELLSCQAWTHKVKSNDVFAEMKEAFPEADQNRLHALQTRLVVARCSPSIIAHVLPLLSNMLNPEPSRRPSMTDVVRSLRGMDFERKTTNIEIQQEFPVDDIKDFHVLRPFAAPCGALPCDIDFRTVCDGLCSSFMVKTTAVMEPARKLAACLRSTFPEWTHLLASTVSLCLCILLWRPTTSLDLSVFWRYCRTSGRDFDNHLLEGISVAIQHGDCWSDFCVRSDKGRVWPTAAE